MKKKSPARGGKVRAPAGAAVFEQRAEQLNRERLERLEEVRRAARPGAPTVEAIIAAFAGPLLERRERIDASPEVAALLAEAHAPLAERFQAALREALPDCPSAELDWGLRFLSGALTSTRAEPGVQQRFIPFVAAGFRALCARAQPPPRPGKRMERRARPRP